MSLVLLVLQNARSILALVAVSVKNIFLKKQVFFAINYWNVTGAKHATIRQQTGRRKGANNPALPGSLYDRRLLELVDPELVCGLFIFLLKP